MRHVFCILFIASLISGILFGETDWDSSTLGNHRAVIKIEVKTDAASVHIPWRRRDKKPQDKNIIVVDAKTGKRIDNLLRININREFGQLAFQPLTAPGKYFVYYMPHIHGGRKNYPTITYPKPKNTTSKEWLTKWKNKLNKIPRAKFIRFQSIDKFNSFQPMEVIANQKEVTALMHKHNDKKYLLFPEDRAYPIRMSDDLPYRWIKSGVTDTFKGNAGRGEFYAFQVGVFAAMSSVENVKVTFSDLKAENSSTTIPASRFNCFNTGGIDWTGKGFKKVCSVKKGKIQALWCGVQVPLEIEPGLYKGVVTVSPKDLEPQQVRLKVTVLKEEWTDAGDGEPWRHSRMRWLDSKIALDYQVVQPFSNMRIGRREGQAYINCLGRRLFIGSGGLPAAIISRFSPEVTHIVQNQDKAILSAPVNLKIAAKNGTILEWKSSGFKFTRRSPGAVGWQVLSSTTDGSLNITCDAQMEFDGFVGYKVTVEALKDVDLEDIRLEIPYSRDAAHYMMGLGLKGGLRKPEYHWKWSVKKNQDGAWIGAVNAGLQYSLRGANYQRPLNTNFYHQKPLNMPVSWYNEGKGGIDITEPDKETVLVNAYSGKRTMKKGDLLHYNFTLLITPFKPIDTEKQWHHRFYHKYTPLKEIKARGANTVNVHHATEINPFINYPFIRPKEMKAYIDDAHKMDMKVKIYYTVRELSNIAPELFALRSLGDEILSYGSGGGFSWIQEHLGDNYIAGWYVPRYKDAAVINSGVSRWHNYYLEGLNWLVKNVGIDGIYIDDVAFDRTVMKRVRKILDRNRKGALIDLHSANQYNTRDGFANSANLYLEHFPYIDRLWFGEYFDYDSQPDFWLVEVSGIPFGLMGEMLQDGGNPRRGMIYGMTSRMPWAGDPSPLWNAWDDFGIKGSQMIGYWSNHCPVKTNHKDVRATVYLHKGKKALIAIAGWGKEDVKCSLQLDWKALGLTKEKIKLFAPRIKNFQDSAVFKPEEQIVIPNGKGLLLILSY